MKREITLQKARILLVYAILAGIIVFEWHFVYSGMMALPILNGVIIAVFFYRQRTDLEVASIA